MTLHRGTVINVEDHGTIVQMDMSDDGCIYWDHREFRRFCEAEADDAGNVNLRDRTFEYDCDAIPPTFKEVSDDS